MREWIKADPVREEQIEQLYQIWKESGEFPYAINTDQSWDRLSVSMDEMEHSNLQSVGQKGKLVRLQRSEKLRKAGVGLRRAVLVAAAVLITLTAGLLTYQQYHNVIEPAITEQQHRVIMTRDGERASYLLSDGTRVMLHAGSRIEIPENYNEENRELYLEGEAFFETAHNPEKPFIVHSGESYTRVVGTEFLVQAWSGAEEQRVEVVVSVGRVLFGSNHKGDEDSVNEVLLSQNQRGQLMAGSTTPVVDEIEDLGWYLGWTEGRLVFENRELREVLPRLERWFNISIELSDDQIASLKITAEIDYSLPMSDVLNGIAMSLSLEVERLDDRMYEFRR